MWKPESLKAHMIKITSHMKYNNDVFMKGSWPTFFSSFRVALR